MSTPMSGSEPAVALKDLRVAFPVGTTEQRRFITATEKVTRACSKNSLATSMSTGRRAKASNQYLATSPA